MHSTEKSNAKIFLDHLYFSVCCVLVGFLLVYSIARWTEHGFDLDDYILACVSAVAALSLILAIFFTYMSISKRSSDFIVRVLKDKDNANRFLNPKPKSLHNAPTRTCD